ncbi:lamin tail domain-containing protein [Ampullimonas aquatilis]|uniref:lamin tail domain-containing protein n=1 Tax=Ampullimonas aquatilis TaxID=1341549 RepID=UPI003C72076F
MGKKTIWQLMLVMALGSTAIQPAHAALTGVKITEWMYNSVNATGEFIELTNFGPTAVNFTGWSYDDNTRVPGSQSLSALGTVNSGESVILTELSAAAFRTAWNLSSSVKVLSYGNNNNLGRADEINIYNSSSALVDRLTYDDQTIGGIRTTGASGRPTTSSAIGNNNALLWSLATVGDSEGSYKSVGAGTSGDIGSPGKTAYVSAVPLPSSLVLLMSSVGLIPLLGKRRNQQ